MKKVAIILSGCGNRDGSELQETLSLFLAVDRKGWQYQCFAPEGMYDTVDHLGSPYSESRDLMAESARVARGNILELSEYRAEDYDALLLPGGMGAARNLSTYAFDGVDMQVRPDVEQAILQTYKASKPIGAMCIAPMVLAKVLGPEGVCLTLGSECQASTVAKQLGAHHQVCAPTEVCVDAEHRVVTTPAYMVGTHISQIFDGGANLVDELEKLAKK